MLIQSYVIQRVLCVQVGNDTGTAFVVENHEKQYIVTARHVVAVAGDDMGPSEILVQRKRQWMPVPVSVVALGEGEKDIAVLAPASPVAVVGAQPVLTGRLAYGQQVRFLGFPFGWVGGGEELTNGYPLPFVNAGIVSAILAPDGPSDATTIYVDAHGNPGFSGGPLVYEPVESQESFGIAGVVTDRLVDPSTETHVGFVRAVGIKTALEMIEENPIGAPISPRGPSRLAFGEVRCGAD